MIEDDKRGMGTGLFDKHGKEIKVGDKTKLKLDDGTIRIFDVVFKQVTRCVQVIHSCYHENMMISGIFFLYNGNYLLPIVDKNGVSDTSKMEIL